MPQPRRASMLLAPLLFIPAGILPAEDQDPVVEPAPAPAPVVAPAPAPAAPGGSTEGPETYISEPYVAEPYVEGEPAPEYADPVLPETLPETLPEDPLGEQAAAEGAAEDGGVGGAMDGSGGSGDGTGEGSNDGSWDGPLDGSMGAPGQGSVDGSGSQGDAGAPITDPLFNTGLATPTPSGTGPAPAPSPAAGAPSGSLSNFESALATFTAYLNQYPVEIRLEIAPSAYFVLLMGALGDGNQALAAELAARGRDAAMVAMGLNSSSRATFEELFRAMDGFVQGGTLYFEGVAFTRTTIYYTDANGNVQSISYRQALAIIEANRRAREESMRNLTPPKPPEKTPEENDPPADPPADPGVDPSEPADGDGTFDPETGDGTGSGGDAGPGEGGGSGGGDNGPGEGGPSDGGGTDGGGSEGGSGGGGGRTIDREADTSD